MNLELNVHPESVCFYVSMCLLVCAGVCMCEFPYPNPARSDTRLPRAAAAGKKCEKRKRRD